jgi:hypothetical protein
MPKNETTNARTSLLGKLIEVIRKPDEEPQNVAQVRRCLVSHTSTDPMVDCALTIQYARGEVLHMRISPPSTLVLQQIDMAFTDLLDLDCAILADACGSEAVQ